MNPLRKLVQKKQAAEQFLQGVGETKLRPALKKAKTSFDLWGAKRQAKFDKAYNSGVRY